MNWIKTGERSASVWFLSPWPILCEKKRKDRRNISDVTGKVTTHYTGIHTQNGWIIVYQLEAVTKAQPLFLQQHFEAADGAVVTVQHEHGQGGELGCAVPAVAAVDHHWCFPRLHLICNPQSSGQNQLQTHTTRSGVWGLASFAFYYFDLIPLHSDASPRSPWCARASEWTPDWRASGSPRCWGRPRPSTCAGTPSSRGCCEYPGTPALHFDKRPHFHIRPLSSGRNKWTTNRFYFWSTGHG